MNDQGRHLTSPRFSEAGASAQQEYERRRANYELQIRTRHPRIGNFLIAHRQEPQHIAAWAKGADGERRIGRVLNELTRTTESVVVLHDRRVPNKRANLDHIAVCGAGVFVIDTKYYKGQIARQDVGSLLRRRPILVAAGRNRSDLVDAARGQADVVRSVVGAHVPVHPVLCFVNAQWRSWSAHFWIDDVLVTAWKPLRRRLTGAKPPMDDRIERTADALDRALDPAVR